MADHDNHVSTNRRRLFKALSVSPVVLTLRPGEALANASGIQCAANEMPAATVKFYKSTTAVCTDDSGAGCHAFEIRNFWDPGISGQEGNCAFWNDKFVVETSENTFYVVINPNFSGAGVSGGELILETTPQANSAVLVGDTMTFYGTAGNSTTPFNCGSATKQQGLFLAIGAPVFDGDVPIGWASYGVWPQYEDDTSNVLGGSCLTSFPDSTNFTLADG